jgi:hypothetical protein
MPESTVNLLYISEEEFKVGFMNMMQQLRVKNFENSHENYFLIRFPQCCNINSLNFANLSLDKLNMKCTSLYDYWCRINDFEDRDDLLYNYQNIVTEIRDYLDYPEIRTMNLIYIEYSFKEIVELIIDRFKMSVIKYSPHAINVNVDNET